MRSFIQGKNGREMSFRKRIGRRGVVVRISVAVKREVWYAILESISSWVFVERGLKLLGIEEELGEKEGKNVHEVVNRRFQSRTWSNELA